MRAYLTGLVAVPPAVPPFQNDASQQKKRGDTHITSHKAGREETHT